MQIYVWARLHISPPLAYYWYHRLTQSLRRELTRRNSQNFAIFIFDFSLFSHIPCSSRTQDGLWYRFLDLLLFLALEYIKKLLHQVISCNKSGYGGVVDNQFNNQLVFSLKISPKKLTFFMRWSWSVFWKNSKK